MSLAIAFAIEARVTVLLIDGLSLQICEPCLNISSRDEDRHSFIRLTLFVSRFDAAAVNLFYSSRNVFPVSIDKHN